MQILNNDIIQYIFNYVPVEDLLTNCTSVSKEMNQAVAKNEGCSIIQNALSIANRAFKGQMSNYQMLTNSIKCPESLHYNHISQDTLKFLLKRDPANKKAFVSFNVMDDTSVLDKAKALFHFSSAIFTGIGQEITQEVIKKQEDDLKKASVIYTKNNVTDILIDYSVEGNKITLLNAKFKPFVYADSMYINPNSIQMAKDFFSSHKIVIQKKPNV